MRILLTGAGGFLGRRLLAMLVGRHDVWCLARNPRHFPGAHAIIADLTHDLDFGALPARIDAVVHVAQSAAYKRFPDGATDMFSINVAATFQLLNFAAAAGVDRFLLASTGSVYEPYHGTLTEDAHCAPATFYPATKMAAESLLAPYGAYMTITALRLFFPYGPGQVQRLVPDLVVRIRKATPVTLQGDGDGLVFTPTYVDDVAAVFVHAIEERWSGTFNVASPEALSVRAAAEEIGRRLGIQPHFMREIMANPPRIVPELVRLSQLYPLDRFRPFSAGIAEMLAE